MPSNRFYGILNAKFNKKLKKKKRAGIGSENESTASIDPSVNKCQAQRQYGILIFKKKLPAGDHDMKRILKSHHHSWKSTSKCKRTNDVVPVIRLFIGQVK